MATIYFTGLETGDASECFATSGTFAVQGTTTAGAWSAYALQVNPTTTATGECKFIGRTNAGNYNFVSVATAYLRFMFRYGTKAAAGDEPIYRAVTGSSTTKFSLRLNSAGKLAAYDSADALLATGTTVLSSGTWYRIETKVGTSATVGAWEVLINGVSEISGTGNLNAGNNSEFSLGKFVNVGGNTVNYYYDDVMWSDSGYPGNGRCTCLLPNSNGTYQAWSIGAGSGSHYQIVDERPPDGDTSYLLSPATTGAAETEALTDGGSAGITSARVNSVAGVVDMKRGNAAASGSMKIRLRSGTTNSDTAVATGVSAVYFLSGQIFDTDPATSAAWTLAALDGIETGAVDQSNDLTSTIKMTFAAAMVDWTPVVPIPQGLFRNMANS